MRYLVTTILLVMFSVSGLLAGNVKGVIKDSDTGEPLIGANVVILGTALGATTDADGLFVILEVPNGDHTLEVSYIGYQEYEQAITVGSGEVTVDAELKSVIITSEAINIVANRAKIRETPVAFTNMDKKEITENLGSRDIPMVLNTTPGVYATQQGGGSGDARINVRGFDQRNTAVLINGVPVNDMENGWVYWSNWDGLGDVTSSVQIQRGLGASNLAISSVGGTLNILTDPAANSREISFKQEYGSGTFLKSTLGAHTGRMDNGLAISATAVRKVGNGVADQTWTDAWAYFAAISYTASQNHTFELYGVGAPQKHGHRLYEQKIETYDADFAREVYERDGLPQELINDLVENGDNRGRNFNFNWGPLSNFDPNGLREFYNGSARDFTERSIYLDGTEQTGTTLMERENFYHKPQFNLNWYWNLSQKAILTSVAYVSFGRGGGTGLKGWPGTISEGTFAGQLNFQGAYDNNIDNVNPDFHPSENQSDVVVRNSVNNHNWYGLLSTLDISLSNTMKLTTGVDLRSYKGEHFREVRNLIGGDYYLDFDDANQSTPVKRLGDKIDYNNDGFTRWAGGFAQIEGRSNQLTYVLLGSLSQTGYKRTDYFVDPNAHLEEGSRILPTESDWQNFTGGKLQLGANYNMSPSWNLYGNLGYNSKAPIFDAVFDFSHQLYQQTFNEKVYAVEIGSGFRTGVQSLNANVYFTRWNDRSWSTSSNTGSGTNYFLLQGIDARHMGIELDYVAKPSRLVQIRAMASIADWEWLNDVETTFAPEDDPTDLQTFNVYAAGLKVGDAAQKTAALAATVFPTKGLYARLAWNGFFDYFADFDPADRDDPDDREQSWKAPSYHLFNLHAGYTFSRIFGNSDLEFFMHVFNLFDTKYIADAVDNGAGTIEHNGQTISHTGANANIYYGLQRNFNLGMQIHLK